MKEFFKNNAKPIAAIVGVLESLLQVILMGDIMQMPGFSTNHMIQGIVFGILAPPILVYLSSLFKNETGHRITRKINEYFNIFYYLIFGCLSLGCFGLSMLLLTGTRDGRTSDFLFFISAGIGFTIAYHVDRKYGKRFSGDS